MTLRTRVVLLAVICVMALGGALAYLVMSRNDQKTIEGRAAAASVAQSPLGAVEAHPRIVFRNLAPGASSGTLAMVPLDDPARPPANTTTPSERVYATSKNMICLSADRGFITTYGAHILDNTMQQTQTLPFIGIPSRARLSQDGSYAATTSFTASDSYGSVSFSTRTYITAVGGQTLGNLVDFTLIHDGKSIDPVDRNYWGVTFAAEDDTFYATVRWSNHTWLVRGGSYGRQTRLGTHAVYYRDIDHTSQTFGGSPMPYSQFFDGGEALHGSAYMIDPFVEHSHGCINMYIEDARQLWMLTNNKRLVVTVYGAWD